MSTRNIAVVTGAGSGIGRATAHHLAEDGNRVVLFDLDEKGLTETYEQLPGSGHTSITVDVTDDEGIRDALAEAAGYGPLKSMVCCAGIEVLGTVAEMRIADWHRVIAVNLTGVFLAARHGIPHIQASEGGCFVAISSDAGVQGAPEYAAYCASKHGVIGLVKAMALDHGPENIRCNAICPGFVETPMADRIFGEDDAERQRWMKTVPAGRFATADEIAEAVGFLVSDRAHYINGHALRVDGGGTAGYFS